MTTTPIPASWRLHEDRDKRLQYLVAEVRDAGFQELGVLNFFSWETLDLGHWLNEKLGPQFDPAAPPPFGTQRWMLRLDPKPNPEFWVLGLSDQFARPDLTAMEARMRWT